MQSYFTRSWAGSEAPSNNAVRPRFYLEPVLNELNTAAVGHPVYDNKERVEIFLPGNPYTRPVHNVTNDHRQRWPREYALFLQGIEQVASGIPISEWPILLPAQVMELKGLGIQTVEEVAALSDATCQPVMGLQRLREKAKAYLDDASYMALTEQLSAEGERARSENASLKRQVDELQVLVNQLHADNQAARNQHHPIATMIPGMVDPAEALRMQQPGDMSRGAPTSSLGAFAEEKRRPGRPRKVQEQPEDVTSF